MTDATSSPLDADRLDLPGQGVEAPGEALALLKSELEPGERLLWADRSTKGADEAPDWLAALIWAGGFAAIAGACWFAARHPSFLAIESIALTIALIGAVIGFLIMIGTAASALPRLGSRGVKQETVYALTDRRAIMRRPAVAAGKGAVEVLSIRRGQVGRLHRVENPDGSGDVVFHLINGAGDGAFPPTRFESVPDVRRVEDLARRVLVAPAGPN